MTQCLPRADSVERGLGELLETTMQKLLVQWPHNLPSGIIHADLFPDNVLFMNGAVSGLIDFYFACNDAFAYDLAVMLNAWCFEGDGAYNVTKGKALIGAYRKMRKLSESEIEALPVLARGSALRFLLTRLYDWLNHDPNALVRPKDPRDYSKRLRFHLGVRTAAEYGIVSRVDIFTDGACSGNPGPGGWAAILRSGAHERELSGGEAATTNNRMELMAVIRALEALKSPSEAVIHTDSRYVMDGATKWLKRWKANGWKTADKKPVKNSELWRALDDASARHALTWRWVQGHAGHAENERADALARAAIP